MRPEEWRFRYALMVFDCLIGFGCYFNVDVPSALQADLQGQQMSNCTGQAINTSCCEECLGLGPDRYNQLYSVNSWMNAVFALPAGFVIDRIGNRVAGLITTFLSCLGSFLFLVSTFSGIKRTSFMFPLMISGRLLLGAGTGSTLIVQNRVISFWFRDRMTLVLGFVFLTLRSGNVSNFLLTAHIQQQYGISASLWIGFGMCCVGVLSAVSLYSLDKAGSKHLDTEIQATEKAPFKLRTIIKLPWRFWLVCFSITTFYSTFLPFVANGSKFIQDKYGYSKQTSSYINGAAYDVAVVISPFVGLILGKIKLNGICLLITVLIYIPVFPLFAFSHGIEPLIPVLVIGFCCTVGGLLLWSTVMIIVPYKSLGTANGISTFVQGLGVGLTNLAIGKILGSVEDPDINARLEKYKSMLLLLLSILSVSLVLIIIVNITDLFGNRKLNVRLQRRTESLERIIDETTPITSVDASTN